MAKRLLALAKGATPDSGGRERPHSRGRLRHQPVLPQCPYYRSFRTVYIDTVVLVIYAFYQFNDLRQKAPWAGCWLYQAVPISGPGGRLHRIDPFTFTTSISRKFGTGKANGQMGRQISHKTCLAEKNRFSGNFCSWIETIHALLDRNFPKIWLNGSRPLLRSSQNQPLELFVEYDMHCHT